MRNTVGLRRGGGRPKGIPNKTTVEVRALAAKLFDRKYWTAIRQRLLKGKVAPAVEVRLLAYAFGEPVKTVQVDGEVTVHEKRSILSQLPDEILHALVLDEDHDTDESVH